jgi:hypothetical protein
MKTQPIALLLAEKLEQQFPLGTAQHYLDGEAAAELRRLHAMNEELLGALRGAVEALDRLTDLVDGTGFSDADDFNRALDEIDLGRAAIAKAGGAA